MFYLICKLLTRINIDRNAVCCQVVSFAAMGLISVACC